MIIRKALEQDLELLFKWTNDYEVRKNSFNQDLIKYEDHKSWFFKKIENKNSDIYILEDSDYPVGQIRIEVENDIATINYSVSSEHRGKGYGYTMLMLIKEYYKNYKIRGKVKPENRASIKAFEKAKYTIIDKQDDYLEYEYIEGDYILEKNMINRNGTIVIAEISANHGNNIEIVKKTIKEAKRIGVDAIKLQTYRPDTLTIKSDKDYFKINQGTLWDGRTLYDLYEEAYTPWEWHKELFELAKKEGIICFSSPFDMTAVDFLEELQTPWYKVASFEIRDLPLIEYMASKQKPMIISTGIATIQEIKEAVDVCKKVGNYDITLLKCTSAYPAPYEEINLKTMKNIEETFGVKIGLSDHTMGSAVAIAAVAMGAKIIEKHIILDRGIGGPDSEFSMNIDEFENMIKDIRIVEKAIGSVNYELTEKVKKNRLFGRSLFFVEDIKEGEVISKENMKSIRPGHGISPKYYNDILGKKVTRNIEKGTPVSWEDIK